jgi:hypothetical protein
MHETNSIKLDFKFSHLPDINNFKLNLALKKIFVCEKELKTLIFVAKLRKVRKQVKFLDELNLSKGRKMFLLAKLFS